VTRFAPFLLSAALAATASAAADVVDPADARDLTRLSIEELANLQVETVSRRPEARIDAPGAVHVVSVEDMRRIGVTPLPDSMRIAPGLQASAIDADEWALTIRGFASRLSRSVLVTLDGRSLWTPLFAGVFWDQHDTSLLDLDRIEVTRGPGGALFGANALNGIIAIRTKPADRTHGGFFNLGVGSAEQMATARHGGAARPDLHYRVWGQYRRRDGTTPTGEGYDDTWRLATGGFRSDWLRGRDTFTLQGDLTAGDAGGSIALTSFTPPFSTVATDDAEFGGGNVLGRWRRGLDDGGAVTVQAYYDRTHREEPHFEETRGTFDLDAQHRFSWGGRHDVVWGVNARHSQGDFRGMPTLLIEPASRADDIASVFAQDEVRLGDVHLTAGAKAEWNDYSGWHLMPSVRAALVLAGRHNLWASVSRAVRTTSRVERDVALYSLVSAAGPAFARVEGNDEFEPESVVAYEAGYKVRAGSRVYLDVTGFYNDYDDLASTEIGAPFLEAGTPPEPPRVVVPATFANLKEGSAWGAEAAVTASLGAKWRVQASYSYLGLNVAPDPASTDRSEAIEDNSPEHQIWIASYFTPREDFDLDFTLRHVGEIPGHRVEAFTELDARAAYRATRWLELALIGQNLLHSEHVEFGGGFAIDRAVRARATVEW
jgi:iron complex outermembrane receptor protein